MGFARSLTMSLENLRVTHGFRTSWSTNPFQSLGTETVRIMFRSPETPGGTSEEQHNN